MSDLSRFLFDECVSHKVMRLLLDLQRGVGENVEFQHVHELQFGGVNDDEWIPQIADGGWVIVTGDRGMHPKPGSGEKLPIVCEQYGVTYAMFSRSWHSRPNQAKVAALFSIWNRLTALHREPRGSGFLIRPLTTKQHEVRVTLSRREWILPEHERFPAVERPFIQQELDNF